MKNLMKKIISMLLAVTLLISLIPSSYALNNFTANLTNEGNKVSIIGSTTKNTNVSLVVYRTEDNDKRYSSQVKSNENGEYLLNFEMEVGSYKAVVNSNGMHIEKEFEIKDPREGFITVRVEGKEKTQLSLTKVKILDNETTIIEAIEKSLKENKIPYKIDKGMITEVNGENGWQWMVNGKGGMTLPTTPVNVNSQIVLIDDEIWNPIITELEVSKNEVKVGEEFTVTLKNVADNTPIANEQILFGDEVKKTDLNGTVKLTGKKKGNCFVVYNPKNNIIRAAIVHIKVVNPNDMEVILPDNDMYINMRIEGYKGTHFDERIKFNPEDYKVGNVYKIKDPDGEEHEFRRPTVFLATIVAWNKRNIKDNKITSNDNYIARMAGEEEFDFKSEHPECGWIYRLNDYLPNIGGGERAIESGDTIEWCYTDTMDSTYFGYLDVSSTSVEVGGSIKVKVTGRNNNFKDSITKKAIDGATVYVGSKEYKTNEKGEVEIKMDEAGNFDVYAIKHDTSSKHDGHYFPTLAKTKKVTVKVSAPNTLFKEAFKEDVKFNSTEYEKIYKEIEDMKKEDDALRKTKSTIEDLSKKVDAVKGDKELNQIIKDISDVSKIAKLCSYKIESQKGGVEAVKNNNTLIKELSKCAQKAKDNSAKKEVAELGIYNIDVILKVSEKITEAKELDSIYNDTITSSLDLSKDLGKDYNNTVNDKIINMAKDIIEKKSAINLSDNKISVQNNSVLANIDADVIKNIENIAKEVKDLKDKLKNGGLDIESKIENNLIINIASKYKNEINISLAPSILEDINNKGFKNIKLKNDIATFNVNKNIFGNKKNLILTAAKLDSKALETLKVDIPRNSTIIELSAREEDKLIENFNTMQIEIPYSISNENKDNLKVFYINEKENNIELAGGKYDEKAKALIFETNHFSKYFVKQINNRFNDLDDVKWAQDAIMDMEEKGIVKGKTDNKFAPNDNVTRAEFSALVTRILKYENADKELPFKDVSSSEWYFKSVASAYSNNLINGRNMNSFDPNGNITREEMAKIIANVLIKKGYKNPQINYITQFKDKENIAPWAKDHVSLCVKENIITGMPDSRFAPSEKATRAQATVMLYRMYKIISNK